MANLTRLITAVHRDFGNKPIWLTEYGYQTNPPDTVLGVPFARQAAYIGQSALCAYQLPGVTMLVQFLVRDDPVMSGFQSGLFTVAGQPKPSYAAFRFPLAQVTRRGSSVTVWGQVRPGSGARTYRLQVGGRWVGGTMRTNGLGFLSRTIVARRGAVVRLWSPQNRAWSFPLVVS